MRPPALALAFLLLVLPVVAAQEATPTPVLVEDLDATYTPRVEKGTEPVEFRWHLYNIDSNTRYFVRVSTRPLVGWEQSITPNQFFLEPLAESNITLRLDPVGRVPERVEFVVTFSLVDSDTGSAFQVQRPVTLIATESALVLGLFANPLPPPLDNVYGVFLLDVLFWVVVGAAAMVVGDAVVRMLAGRMPHDALRNVLTRLRRSVFLLVVAIGLERSFRVLPGSPPIDALSILLKVVVVVLWAVVGYRVLGAFLDYYSSVVAVKTETKIDDVLVPVVRKIAAVIVVIVALGFVMELFGLSLNLVFGAAGIAGLVIAFAAQDTLSNFFGGVFLLVDRPFSEGDDIQIETGEIARVENIGLRTTRLYHYRNHEFIILPNNQLASRKVVNLSAPDRRYRVAVNVGVDYRTDVARARAIVERVVRAHPALVEDADHPLFVGFERFGDSALELVASFFVTDVRERIRAASDVRELLLEAFRAEGIEIPFPHRTVIVKGDLPVGRA